MRAWRWPVRFLIPGLVIAGLVLDPQLQVEDDPDEVAAELAPVAAVPPLEQLSSTWFCPAVQLRQVEGAGISAEANLVVTNLSEEATEVLVELLSPTSPPRTLRLDVAPGQTRRVPIEGEATDDVVSAIVEAPRGGIAVSREFATDGALDAARCSSRPATTWYLPTGDTQRDATSEIVVFNPLPSDAVVDLVFATEAETGTFVAVDLEGLVVGPRSVVRIDLGEHVRRRDVIATTITTRAGRVVVDHFQAYDGSAGRSGMSVSLGIAERAERWVYPGGYIDEDAFVEVVVMNPTDEVAEVDLASVSPLGGGNPVAITIGPRDVAVVPVQPFVDIPPAVPTLEVVPAEEFGIVVESANGVPVVAAVEIGAGSNTAPSADDADGEVSGDSASEQEESAGSPEASAPDGATSIDASVQRTGRPRARSGRALVPAVATGRTRWMVVAPPTDAGIAYLAIQSSTAGPIQVSVSELGGARSEELSLDGVDLEVLSVVLDAALLIEADGPIAVTMVVEVRDGAGLIGLVPLEF